MNPGGDAAEQVVRLSLEGVEVAAKITGYGAKNIALLLYATLKQEQKTKGKARLTSMLKSGKELKVYTITQKDLAKFSKEAKRYGVLYCVLKDRKNKDPNAAVDVIARADDASKIQRITERFKLATVNRADVSLDIKRDRDKMFPKEKSVKDALRGGKTSEENVLPDHERELSSDLKEEPIDGRPIMNKHKQEEPINPSLARTDRDHLSGQNSTQVNRSNGFHGTTKRSSVREKLEGYKAEITRVRTERVKELAGKAVSKGIDAAANEFRSASEPGRDR